jgi:hypothetical protein
MISAAVAMLLLGAAPEPPAKSREAYARCLKDLARTSLEKKMDAAAFEAALAGACRDKEALFKTSLISSEVAMGVKRAVAEKGIQEEIASYRSETKEGYQAELASAPQP